MNSTTSRTVQTAILALVAFGLVALALGGYLAPLSRLVVSPLVDVQTWVSTRYLALEQFLTAPQDLAYLRQRNTELESEVARLQAEVIELQQQVSEMTVMSALLDFASENTENRYVAAQVIGRDTSPFLYYVIINRGSDDGLRRGMTVITAQGLVGRISAVSAGAARVQLITDAGARVNVRLKESGAEAVLNGQLTGDLTLEMIPQAANVQAGELILTSGLGGNFPANILIGQVSGIRQRDFDIFQSASVQPVVDFSELEIVLVIVNFRPVDISPLVPTPGVP